MPKDLRQGYCLKAELLECRNPDSQGAYCSTPMQAAPPIRKTQVPPKSGPSQTRYQFPWRNSLSLSASDLPLKMNMVVTVVPYPLRARHCCNGEGFTNYA